MLLGTHASPLMSNPRPGNIPKYLVALGMIVTLLEDQIHATEHLATMTNSPGYPIGVCCTIG